jgi:hypothetical protein
MPLNNPETLITILQEVAITPTHLQEAAHHQGAAALQHTAHHRAVAVEEALEEEDPVAVAAEAALAEAVEAAEEDNTHI